MIPPIKSWLRRSLVVAAAVASATQVAAAPSEFDLKAVFLFHFTQFVEWPAKTFSTPDSPFVIGLIGKDPFGSTLDNVIRGERVGQHPLVLEHVNDLASARRCQILYVAAGGEARFAAEGLQGAPVLTVGESEAFSQAGGVVEFVTERSHVRLRINLAAARSDSLTISAKLLRVSEVTGN